MTDSQQPKSELQILPTADEAFAGHSVRRFRMLLAAAACLYPFWALVLAHDAPGTYLGMLPRFAVAALSLVVVLVSVQSHFVRTHIERLAFIVAVIINTNNGYLVYVNKMHYYYVIGYLLCLFGIAIAFESRRLLLAFLVVSGITAVAVNTTNSGTTHLMFISSTLITGVMSVLCFHDKLRLLQALKRQNRNHEVSRLMLNETQKLANLGGWSYNVRADKMWWSEQTYDIHEVPPTTRISLLQAIDFFGSDVQEFMQQKFQAAINDGEPFDVEGPLTSALGRELWVRQSCTVERDSTGKVKRLIGSLRDITVEHRLSQALIEREASSRAVIDAIPGYVSWIDSDMRYVGVNRALAATFQMKQEDFAGKILGFRQGDKPDQVADFARQLFSQPHESLSKQVIIEAGPGVKKTFLLSAQKYRNDREAVIIGIDISERHKVERELSEQKELLAAVLDHMPLGVYAKDAANDYRYIIWNRAMEKMAGVSALDVLGRTDHALYPNFEADLQRRTDSEVVASRVLLDTPDETLNLPGGTFPAHTVRVPVYSIDGSPRMVLGVAESIAEKKQREELIASQHIQLMHASKMSTLGEMSGGVAHEINNPLTIIAGFSQRMKKVLEQETIDVADLMRCTSKIHLMTERIAKIVRGLRTFAREASHDPFEPHPVRGILTDTLELCEQRFANNGVELGLPEIPDSLLISCRPVQISQVLLNLLNNAYDAVLKYEEKWVRLSIDDQGDCVVFAVTDGGPKIPDDVAQKIMHPFFTTKGIGQGTGLGLSISRGIIESHGGTLQLDRAHPTTRFVFVLPKEPITAQLPQPKAA